MEEMPDSFSIEFLDRSPQPGKRRRRKQGAPEALGPLPAEWREMTIRWLRRGEKSTTGCRWETLVKDAGAEHYSLTQQVLDWLLNAGWVAVVEQRRHAAWWPIRVEFLDLPALRNDLGLPDPEAPARRWALLRTCFDPASEPDLALALSQLDGFPATRAADRAELLLAISRWRLEQRGGTRRDFAHFARGATKSITEAEWCWLEGAIDLAAFAIERHTPMLLIAAPLVLEMPKGLLDIGVAPDFAALTPATVRAACSATGTLARWRLVENRTSFERVARSREADTGVVWLPGFPPGWWREAMAQLLKLAPAPAEIACDPDPAGIAIALEAAQPWQAAGISWQPWRMDVTDLAALSSHLPLSPIDRNTLEGLIRRPLPAPLDSLAEWMWRHDKKGEQEGYL